MGTVDVLISDGKMVVLEPRRCRTCKWWGKAHEALGRIPGGMRTKPMLPGDAGVCLLTETKSLEAEHPQSKAIVWEGDEYCGVLVTAADFGCVQWEARGE